MQIHPALVSNQKRSYAPESTDSFLLELDAYNRTFCMHLFPNLDLLHPDARMVEVKPAGLVSREQVKWNHIKAKAYKGFVVSVMQHDDDMSEAMYDCKWSTHLPTYEQYDLQSLGWARITLKTDM
jgi:hypothetical protein